MKTLIKTTALALLVAALPFANIASASDRDHSRGGHESHRDGGGYGHDRGYHRGHHRHRHWHRWHGHHHGHDGHRDDYRGNHRVGVVLPLPPLPPPVIIVPGRHH